MTAADGCVSVPLRFAPLSPGRYPCKILLTSRYDVRLYCVEGVVNEEYPEAKFEFQTPAFEPLVQNIPIVSVNFLKIVVFISVRVLNLPFFSEDCILLLYKIN